jgi:hypothetical protein
MGGAYGDGIDFIPCRVRGLQDLTNGKFDAISNVYRSWRLEMSYDTSSIGLLL